MSAMSETGRGPRVLVVDDDVHIVRIIRDNLRANGYDVLDVQTGAGALDALDRRHPDLVLLDLGLPDLEGATVIEHIRDHSQIPIVVLSARGEEREKVRALDLGADDYLTKPFGIDELLARVRVALRHALQPAQFAGGTFRTGDIEVDLGRRRVTVRGEEVHLRPTEYELLKVFIANPDRVLTHHWLLQRVWGPMYGDEGNYLHVYVAGLRKKLEPNPKRPVHFITEPGVGYRFRLTEPA
jgi:two-component system, OmpR family, KDP operon response regulator KdpE